MSSNRATASKYWMSSCHSDQTTTNDHAGMTTRSGNAGVQEITRTVNLSRSVPKAKRQTAMQNVAPNDRTMANLAEGQTHATTGFWQTPPTFARASSRKIDAVFG